MTNHIQNIQKGVVTSRQWSTLQARSSIAMVTTAVLAYATTSVLLPGISGLGLATAAATGFSVGFWCQPSAYRTRSGSLALAVGLLTFMWAVPVIVLLASLSG